MRRHYNIYAEITELTALRFILYQAQHDLVCYVNSLELVPFLEFPKLTVDSLSHFISVPQQRVPSQLKIFLIVSKNHMQFKALVHSKNTIGDGGSTGL